MYKLFLFDQYEQLSEELIYRALQFLPADRHTQALRYRRKVDKNNCVVTYLMLLYGLREYFGINTFKIAFGKYGKPYLLEHPGVQFSISHCDVGCAVVVADCPVGVDIQDVRPFSWGVAKRVCSNQELVELAQSKSPNRLFTKMWVMKEIYGKMIGMGMMYELQNDYRRENDVSIYVDERRNYTIGLCIKGSTE